MCAEKVFYEVAYVCRCVRVIMRSIACNSLLPLLYYESAFLYRFYKKKKKHTHTYTHTSARCVVWPPYVVNTTKQEKKKKKEAHLLWRGADY